MEEKNQAAIFCQVLYIVTGDKDHRVRVSQSSRKGAETCRAVLL